MNTERLLILADFLADLPKERFAISRWFKKDGESKSQIVPNECTYAACAVGHACYIPELRAQGLRVVGGAYLTPYYEGDIGPAAVMEFFDISSEGFSSLFHPRGYLHNEFKMSDEQVDKEVTPAMVEAKIRSYVANYLKPFPFEGARDERL